MSRINETVFNSTLADVLCAMHPEWVEDGSIRAESSQLIKGKPSLRPDLIVCQSGGVPVIIESEFDPAASVEQDAIDRLGLPLIGYKNPIEQSIALKIPSYLAHTIQSNLKTEIKRTDFEFCVFSLNKRELNYAHRWPKSGWASGNLDNLADLIEMTALSENVLNSGLDILQDKISTASSILRRNYQNKQIILNKISESLHQKDCVQTTHMAMAIVLNAILFHKSLIGFNGVKSFEEIWKPTSAMLYNKRQLIEHWDHIVTNINYFPIFSIAMEILEPLDDKSKEVLEVLFQAADELTELGATTRHDLCGRLFQSLITDRKFLATFYTLPSSAALLAEIAINRLKVDWSESNEIESLRVADFACGTGALLNASLHSILSKHVRQGGDGKKIHKHLVEKVMVGIDIMPAATHLTASIIEGVYPNNNFNNTSIYTIPYGRNSDCVQFREVSLGSLELLDSLPVLPAFDTGERKLNSMKGNETKTDVTQEVPDCSCDLVIMNPPFTRPTGHEGESLGIPVPSFAGLNTPEIEQRLMSTRLRKLMTPDMVGHGNAGLASNFFDIAHKKVKMNGVVALVLPSTFLQGDSWSKMRELLEEFYSDIVIFSIANSGHTNRAFSSDTGMAEVLLIATRSDNADIQKIKFINLVERPKTIAEAVIIAKKVEIETHAESITLGNAIVANIFVGDFSNCGFSGVIRREPVQTAQKLSENLLVLPQIKKSFPINVAKLGELGAIGKYSLDIIGKGPKVKGLFRGPFDLVSPPSSNFVTYPMLWKHEASRENKLVVEPDSEGKIRKNHEEKAEMVWLETKSKLHFNKDFRLNSQPLAACYTERETIGGHAWPNVILNDSKWDIPILLWANTTLGLISFWWQGTRQQLGRVRLSKSILPNLLVLDARKLSRSQINQAEDIFEAVKRCEFLPANEAYKDQTRKLLDQEVLVNLLGLPERIVERNLNLLRYQWCDEPTVHGGKKTAPTNNDFQEI